MTQFIEETSSSPFDAPDNSNDSVVVIYHDNCIDGFTSAWAFHKLAASAFKNVEYVPASYQQNMPQLVGQVSGKYVYILDFSFPRDALEEICFSAEFVYLLDHHKTAQADLQDTSDWPTRPDNLYIEFDMTRSGAGIIWDHFSSRMQRPALVNYVEDRDLWKFALSDSKEINAYIAVADKTFESYNYLAEALNIPGMCGNIGHWLMKQHDKICKELTQLARPFEIHTVIDGEEYEFIGLSVNTNGQFSSEVGNLLANISGTFGATYYADRNGSVKFSLRSNGNYDVSRIAKVFGGGGHKNAAGFVLKETEHERYSPVMKVWSYVPTSQDLREPTT